jgi:transposase-like protein
MVLHIRTASLRIPRAQAYVNAAVIVMPYPSVESVLEVSVSQWNEEIQTKVARALEVNPNVLHRWGREVRQGPGNVFPGQGKQHWAEGRIAELERKTGQQALTVPWAGLFPLDFRLASPSPRQFQAKDSREAASARQSTCHAGAKSRRVSTLSAASAIRNIPPCSPNHSGPTSIVPPQHPQATCI